MAKTTNTALLLSLSLGIASCGPGAGAARGLSSGSSSLASTAGTTTTLTNGSGSTSGSSSASAGGSPLSIPVNATGYVSTSVSVSAGQILRLTFSPGQADAISELTGQIPHYSQLGVYISVESLSLQSGMLTNGYANTTAETSQILDFSQIAAAACAGQAASCRTSLTVTISKPNTDYWCLNYGEACPYNKISMDQPWNGTLTVQTDDTTALVQ